MAVNLLLNLATVLPPAPPKVAKPPVSFGAFEPTSLAEYIGQEAAKQQIRMELESAKRDGRPLRHIFLYGPPGTGKTTLVKIIAKETTGYLYESTGSQFSAASDVIDGFAEYETWPVGSIWLIDEVSEMAKTASTVFHAPMTQGYVLWKGEKVDNETIRNLVLAGTTNYVAKSPGAFRDRFDLQIKLGYYSAEELERVVQASAERIGVGLTSEATYYLARHAAGTPRNINRLLRTAAAYIGKGGTVGEGAARKVTLMLGIHRDGLDGIQVQYLRTLAKATKKTMGCKALAAALGEDVHTLEDVWEPYLLYRGLTTVTGSGRRITEAGEEYLGKLGKSA